MHDTGIKRQCILKRTWQGRRHLPRNRQQIQQKITFRSQITPPSATISTHQQVAASDYIHTFIIVLRLNLFKVKDKMIIVQLSDAIGRGFIVTPFSESTY